MTRRLGSSAWRSVAAIAALTLGTLGCTLLLSLEDTLQLDADASTPAADGTVPMTLMDGAAAADASPAPDAYVAPPPPPPDPCTAKGWHFDCSFGVKGVLMLDEVAAASPPSPPFLTRAGTALLVTGSAADGGTFLYAIADGGATSIGSPQLFGAPVDIVYRSSVGVVAILTNVTDDAGVVSAEAFVLTTSGSVIGSGGGPGSDVNGFVGKRLVAIDFVPGNPVGSLLILSTRSGAPVFTDPIFIRTNYPVGGSTATPVVLDAGSAAPNAAVEIVNGDSGVIGWIASRAFTGGLVTYITDGTPAFSAPSELRFNDALGVGGGGHRRGRLGHHHRGAAVPTGSLGNLRRRR